MAIHIEIDEADERELARIRANLTQCRQDGAISQTQLAILARRSDKWINELEQGIGHPHVFSLQQWAGMFDLRLEPQFQGLANWAVDDLPHEVLLNWQMSYKASRPFRAYEWQRVHLVAELVAFRHAAGVSAAELSRKLGLSVSAVSGWERDGNDPLISKVFTYVRALGGSVTFQFIKQADWPYGSTCTETQSWDGQE